MLFDFVKCKFRELSKNSIIGVEQAKEKNLSANECMGENLSLFTVDTHASSKMFMKFSLTVFAAHTHAYIDLSHFLFSEVVLPSIETSINIHKKEVKHTRRKKCCIIFAKKLKSNFLRIRFASRLFESFCLRLAHYIVEIYSTFPKKDSSNEQYGVRILFMGLHEKLAFFSSFLTSIKLTECM